MINSVICVDCVCLPMCVNKSNTKLMTDCIFIKNTIINISAAMDKNAVISINFKGLGRELDIEKEGKVTWTRSRVYPISINIEQ